MEKKDFDMEFPLLNSSIINYDFYFQYELVYLYFHSFRKTDNNLLLLSSRLDNVLHLLKKQLRNKNNVTIYYLKQYFKLLVHTRDIIHGKGEHLIVYNWITIWYKYFPTLTNFFIYSLCYNGLVENLGCWRDMKYLCEYVKDHSSKKDKHPIIKTCIEIMNKQLFKDYSSLFFDGTDDISNVSKWIPRENKHFDWLYTLLVIDWFSLSESESLLSNISKYKRKYRKYVSILNYYLDTTQIKQCSLQYDKIIPENVSKPTLSKNPCLLYKTNFNKKNSNIQINKRQQCYDSFKKFFEKKIDIRKKNTPIKPILLPVSYYIKQAFQLLTEKSNSSESISKTLQYRIDILNKQWSIYSDSFSKNMGLSTNDSKKHILPFMDASFSIQSIDSESYYTCIGICILLCHYSIFGNHMFVVDNKPTWVPFNDINNLFEIIELFI